MEVSAGAVGFPAEDLVVAAVVVGKKSTGRKIKILFKSWFAVASDVDRVSITVTQLFFPVFQPVYHSAGKPIFIVKPCCNPDMIPYSGSLSAVNNC